MPDQTENKNMDQLEHSPTFSSPTSAVSPEETKLLTEYISQQNLFKIARFDEARRKPLMLKRFFKMKRNQQVVVSSLGTGDNERTTEGKVSAVGRDFVMLTNLKTRIWIPYTAISSATIPFGYPTYSNTHQHYLYDNHLQQKLVLQFGETVAKKDALIQQFFEETLVTSLTTWEGSRVEVVTAHEALSGRIAKTAEGRVIVHSTKEDKDILVSEIRFVSLHRVSPVWSRMRNEFAFHLAEWQHTVSNFFKKWRKN